MTKQHMDDARIVRERQDAFDMQSGPYGYERVGFAIGARVFWVGCTGSGMPAGSYGQDEALAQEIVMRWNGKSERALFERLKEIAHALGAIRESRSSQLLSTELYDRTVQTLNDAATALAPTKESEAP